MRLPRYGWPDGVPPNGMRLRCGRAPHRADPLPPQARHNRQILRCGLQGPPFATIAHIAEELAMAWGRRAVWPRMKTRPHKPAVRARRGLINAADAAPTDKTRPRLLSQERAFRRVARIRRSTTTMAIVMIHPSVLPKGPECPAGLGQLLSPSSDPRTCVRIARASSARSWRVVTRTRIASRRNGTRAA